MTMGGLLDRVVNSLEQDQNLPRIKKLLYCACYGSWEDDLNQINRVSLRDVINAVWDQSPTLDALQFQLNRIVKTLNKPVEYAHVANVILRQVEPLYRDAFDVTRPLQRQPDRHAASQPDRYGQPEATRWLAPQPPSPTTRLMLQAQALQSLTGHGEQTRLKKMMLCACSNAWENDAQRLAAIDWSQLLQSVLERQPTIEALERSLQEIVSALSKPLDYVPIANLLLQLLAPLYANPYANQPEATQFFGAPEATQFFGSSIGSSIAAPPPPPPPTPSYSGPIRYPAAPTAPRSASATQWAAVPPSVVNYPPPEPAGVLEPTGVLEPHLEPHLEPQYLEPRSGTDRIGPDRIGPNGQGYSPSESRSPEPIQVVEPIVLDARSVTGNGYPTDLGHAEAPFVPAKDERNQPFTLRLEVMKYANPLMAKMVMFSVLKRPFNFGEQDWLDLQDVSLDELLNQLQAQYPSLADLEAKLCASAEQLAEVKDRALQAAAAIVKALKPIYADRAEADRASSATQRSTTQPQLGSSAQAAPAEAQNGFSSNGFSQNGLGQNGSGRIAQVQP